MYTSNYIPLPVLYLLLWIHTCMKNISLWTISVMIIKVFSIFIVIASWLTRSVGSIKVCMSPRPSWALQLIPTTWCWCWWSDQRIGETKFLIQSLTSVLGLTCVGLSWKSSLQPLTPCVPIWATSVVACGHTGFPVEVVSPVDTVDPGTLWYTLVH